MDLVDNSDVAPNRLTGHTHAYMIWELFLPPISNSEDRYGALCVRVPARGLLHPLSSVSLASLLALSSAFPLTNRQETHDGPPSAQAAHRAGLPFLSSRLHSFAGYETCSSSCTPLARGEKPPRCPQTGEHLRLRLSQPKVRVLWHHRRFRPCPGWGWQAWPCRAHPDVSLPGLPHHVQRSTRHSLVPSENLYAPGRHGALGAGRRAGRFRG